MTETSESEFTKASIAALLGKTPKLIGKINSMIDKIDDISIANDGTVTHNILRITKKLKKTQKLGAHRVWPSIASFKKWRNLHLKARREALRERMSPL